VRHERSPTWIEIANLLLCMVSVVIVAAAPTKAKIDGVKPKVEFLVAADWVIAQDSDVGLFCASREVGRASLDRDSFGNSTSLVTIADGSVMRAVRIRTQPLCAASSLGIGRRGQPLFRS
jgi:hypothetical protein